MFNYNDYYAICVPSSTVLEGMKDTDKYIGIISKKDKVWHWITPREACELGFMEERHDKYSFNGYIFDFEEDDSYEPNMFKPIDGFNKSYYMRKWMGTSSTKVIQDYTKVCAFMQEGATLENFELSMKRLCKYLKLEDNPEKRMFADINLIRVNHYTTDKGEERFKNAIIEYRVGNKYNEDEISIKDKNLQYKLKGMARQDLNRHDKVFRDNCAKTRSFRYSLEYDFSLNGKNIVVMIKTKGSES